MSDEEQFEQLDAGAIPLLVGKDRVVIFCWLIKVAVNIAIHIAGKDRAMELLTDTIEAQFTDSTEGEHPL